MKIWKCLTTACTLLSLCERSPSMNSADISNSVRLSHAQSHQRLAGAATASVPGMLGTMYSEKYWKFYATSWHSFIFNPCLMLSMGRRRPLRGTVPVTECLLYNTILSGRQDLRKRIPQQTENISIDRPRLAQLQIQTPKRNRSLSEVQSQYACARFSEVTCHVIMAEGELNVDSIITRLLEGKGGLVVLFDLDIANLWRNVVVQYVAGSLGRRCSWLNMKFVDYVWNREKSSSVNPFCLSSRHLSKYVVSWSP